MGEVPNAVFALPKLKLLQLQNNSLRVDQELAKSNKVNYTLFDMGFKSLQFENNLMHDFEMNEQIRTADTKFEDID